MVVLDDVQQRNFRVSRDVFDAWYTGPDADREAWWVRLVAALWTESGCRVLAHTGTWGGGGWINDAQKAVLKTSSQYPHDGFGSNGGSVGALQQIPTPVAQLATDQATGKSKAWGGWGTIPDCMALETSVPKFLAQLRVTTNPYYGSKPMADPIVADLLRVQQPLESEVDANYGASIVSTAKQVAVLFPRTEPTEKEWSDMATRDEFVSALREVLDTRLDGIDENAGEARRINGVLAGVTSLAGNGERSVEQQVFDHELPNNVGKLGNFLAELNRKVDLLVDIAQKGA